MLHGTGPALARRWRWRWPGPADLAKPLVTRHSVERRLGARHVVRPRAAVAQERPLRVGHARARLQQRKARRAHVRARAAEAVALAVAVAVLFGSAQQ